MTCMRSALAALAVFLGLLALPTGAGASSSQFSMLQDDAVFLGLTEEDPNAALAEAKALGVDYVRVFVGWQRVSPAPKSRRMPGGFEVGDPDSPGYDWARYDDFVERARANGLKVFLTLSPAIPYWASEEPRRCPHFVGGYRKLGKSCYWKPRPRLFGQFAKAVALRYGGRVSLWSIWNEPNLEHYLYPQVKQTRFGKVDVAAKRYRRLWIEGHRAIARYDPVRRNKVLFGETAAISSPMDTLFAALCLDETGKPFRGELRALHGCTRPGRLPIGGIAHHPYNRLARGSVFTRSFTQDSLAIAYIGRLGRLMDTAARMGRIPPGRGIFMTEFGFQTNPPDRKRGISLRRHAAGINEADRLYYADPRVKATSQFELRDVPEGRNDDVYNTGLRFLSGRRKPAWRAFRMPIVVTKLSRDRVEVWGHVRPAEAHARARVHVIRSGRPDAEVAAPVTNRAGFFKIVLRGPNASKLRYRMEWTDLAGKVLRSRVATAGRRIRYFD